MNNETISGKGKGRIMGMIATEFVQKRKIIKATKATNYTNETNQRGV